MHSEGSFPNRVDWALASLDLSSIARGFKTLDAIVKRATVKVEMARPVSSGRFVILFSGDIADVEESYAIALETAHDNAIDHTAITNPHAELVRNFKRVPADQRGRSVLIAEFNTVSSTLLAADRALKICDVSLSSMALADGIAGKGFFVLSGALCDVEAAFDAVESSVRNERLIAREVIANPHSEIVGFF
jgi:microcompartment protein CcmL/EutN